MNGLYKLFLGNLESLYIILSISFRIVNASKNECMGNFVIIYKTRNQV